MSTCKVYLGVDNADTFSLNISALPICFTKSSWQPVFTTVFMINGNIIWKSLMTPLYI